jgi:glycosyltransferase involved in cell wall biosynthesis
MAAGTPVVATGPTGGFDTLEPEADVLVVPSSAESFVSSVNRLYTDRDFYFQIARAAQTKARSLTRDAWQELLCERADQMIKERRR